MDRGLETWAHPRLITLIGLGRLCPKKGAIMLHFYGCSLTLCTMPILNFNLSSTCYVKDLHLKCPPRTELLRALSQIHDNYS